MDLRNHYAFLKDELHLNNAGTSPTTKRGFEALQKGARLLLEHGAHAIPTLLAEFGVCRGTFAKLTGTIENRVAFTANLATAISMVAHGLPFQEGDRILTIDQEYPSNAYVWYEIARQKNLILSHHPSNEDTSINWDSFISQIKPGVRAVVLSWVQFRTGVTAPLQKISEACRRADAWLIVDGIQALGVLPCDINQLGVDILCGGSHKWLSGAIGHGFLCFREDLFMQMHPILQGALTYGTPDDAVNPEAHPVATAKRFEPGAPAFLLCLAAAASTEVLMQTGIQKIQTHAMNLSLSLIKALESMGLRVLGDDIANRQSPIVTFSSPSGAIENLHKALNERKVAHAYRNGTIRLSPHGFNDEDEINEVIEILKKKML